MGFNGSFSRNARGGAAGRRLPGRPAAGGIVLTRPGQDPSYGLSPDDPYDAIDRLPADRA
jgi:hypothetical protein